MTRSSSETLIQDFQEGVESVGNAVQRTGRHLASDAAEVASDVSSHVADLGGRALAAAKARPRTVLAIGAAAGALLAFLLRRRRR
jgi:hypothetical protein